MLYLKALHVIFVVTWFAGLFYEVRLFVYFAEAAQAPEPERSILQRHLGGAQRRLWYGITWPSAVLATVFGGLLLTWWTPFPPWLLVKLGLVAGLWAYHVVCHVILRQQQRGQLRISGARLRLWNEVATLFLVAIVFLVVCKGALDLRWVGLSMLGLGTVLFLAAVMYRRHRRRTCGLATH